MTMRYRLIVFSCLFLLVFLSGNIGYTTDLAVENTREWTWSSMELISDISNFSSYNPYIFVDENFYIHVIWGEQDTYTIAGDNDSYQDIIYQRWNLFSEEYYAPELVSSTTLSTARDPYCTMDHDGNIHVLWEDNTVFFKDTGDWDIIYSMWNASTQEWTFPRMLSMGTNDSYNPVICVTPSGERHVFWDERNITREVYHRPNINGEWLGIEEITIEDETYDAVSPSAATDEANNIHLTWIDYSDYSGAGEGTGSIFYKKYDNILDSWLGTAFISTESVETIYSQSIAVDSTGKPHVVWQDMSVLPLADDGNPDIFYKTMNSETAIWTSTQVISTDSTASCQRPTFTIDPSNNIHVVWEDCTNFGGAGFDWDLVHKMWNSTAETWGPMTLLTPESSENSMQPHISCDRFGFLYLIWDDQMDVSGAGTDADIFYKYLAGEPSKPILSSINQNPNKPLEIALQWTDSLAAVNYKVYRENSLITSPTGLTPHVTVTESEYTDTLTTSGTFYYAISATNDFGMSELSNVEFITVTITTTDQTSTTSPGGTFGFTFLILITGLLFLSRKKKKK